MRNLLSINDLGDNEIEHIFGSTKDFLLNKEQKFLSGKLLINLFFESSTRTSSSFEIAAKRLGMQVININISDSSINKGETALDTVRTLDAMNPDFMVIRHSESGGVKWLANHVNCSVINAGDGSAEHPTQALLDVFTALQKHKDLRGLKVAICGDVLHSRVARSDIMLFERMGAEVYLIAPPPFALKHIKTYYNMKEGLEVADILIMLRLQKERFVNLCFPREFSTLYRLDEDKLKYAKPNLTVMHPGPVGAEISAAVKSDLENNVILDQVRNGVAIRAGLISYIASR